MKLYYSVSLEIYAFVYVDYDRNTYYINNIHALMNDSSPIRVRTLLGKTFTLFTNIPEISQYFEDIHPNITGTLSFESLLLSEFVFCNIYNNYLFINRSTMVYSKTVDALYNVYINFNFDIEHGKLQYYRSIIIFRFDDPCIDMDLVSNSNGCRIYMSANDIYSNIKFKSLKEFANYYDLVEVIPDCEIHKIS